MRVAALYDIHGNLPALEAVLDRVRDLMYSPCFHSEREINHA